ncbi:hypothetical protein [Corynebacterium simulans]|uniref:hypothetical protein n=1 Tax=Corynebacterium TaxID=1716 RepID=UPI002006C964|nr:hypothetical protein [Corynebacterium simulans]MCK6160124.1 hypothetical protein [Corynebacterium simulans]
MTNYPGFGSQPNNSRPNSSPQFGSPQFSAPQSSPQFGSGSFAPGTNPAHPASATQPNNFGAQMPAHNGKGLISGAIIGLIAAFLFLAIVLGAAAYFLLPKDIPDAPADTVSTPTSTPASTAPTTMSDVPSENV